MGLGELRLQCEGPAEAFNEDLLDRIIAFGKQRRAPPTCGELVPDDAYVTARQLLEVGELPATAARMTFQAERHAIRAAMLISHLSHRIQSRKQREHSQPV